MLIRVSFSGRDSERLTGLPAVLHLEEGTTLSRAIDAIERQSSPDNLLSPTSGVAVGGNHAGTLAAPDHRVLREGDEICIYLT